MLDQGSASTHYTPYTNSQPTAVKTRHYDYCYDSSTTEVRKQEQHQQQAAFLSHAAEGQSLALMNRAPERCTPPSCK
eukprot:CAMPEP_0202914460 /NCGR_PEP_ID=MMETSP1392-20130828/63144_1 /ASSEMBLY_ACC=CAM_ASM_000868 /TAXON_ID=225041 /ORGANISM="Chlamydomonas chlamydogama, Strain SAG 11-48b" /LENGTH=76 /DNA_ID=CAMNT_0049606109 /DNA_START=102 /DNA_END=332 /DNA_ORIENTATION=-